MAETILKGSLKEVSTTPNAEIFSLEVPPEEQLRFFRDPNSYLRRLLLQEGRQANEVHILHLSTPSAALEEKPTVEHFKNCAWV